MAQGKKTFIFYSDWINMVQEMEDKDAGELLKHVLSYVNDNNPETKNPFVKIVFAHMKPILKADLKKWEEIREKRKKAGAKGGKQTHANAKQMLSKNKQVQAVNDNVNVSTDVDSILKPYNDFIDEVKKGEHNIVTESWLMKLKIPKTALTELLTKDYRTQLITDNKQHKNSLEVRKHFYAFLNKLDQIGKLDKYKARSKGML